MRLFALLAPELRCAGTTPNSFETTLSSRVLQRHPHPPDLACPNVRQPTLTSWPQTHVPRT
jgi:hypothetical protein